jgi:DNA-directed RNA polymerase subunit RPC12/RpoP
MAEGTEGGDRILIQVCLECGKEYMFENTAPPENLSCDRCGGKVFRSFDAATKDDEVRADFREATERDTATDDPATDVTRGDLQDLVNL